MDDNRESASRNSRVTNSHPGTRLIEPTEWQPIARQFRLSDRELQVLRLLFEGNTRESVSRILGIRPRTARQYVEQIHGKIGVCDRVELVLRLIECRDALRQDR